MRLFTCATCKQVLFFENVQCTRCGHALAYLQDEGVVSALEPAEDGLQRALAAPPDRRYRLCANYTEHAACNWAVPVGAGADGLCQACSFNDVIPDLSDPAAKEAWQRIELAKRRLIYLLRALGLPLERKVETERGLAFNFLKGSATQKVFTGHSEGLITIDIAEADDPFREKMRKQMGETYRTLLGHFRHEIGHYYWTRLIEGGDRHPPFRERFGDERQDYAEALKRHYAHGAPADWASTFVSAYASMHPWEDWAETWAHYLHMVDTLETARSYGLALRPTAVGGAPLDAVTVPRLDFDDFDDLITAWVPLTIALNSLNRAMGLQDAYPFVLGKAPIDKLRFVHDTVDASTVVRTLGA